MKNWDPSHYDQNSFVQYDTSMSMLEKLILNGNETILDVGSGTGKITEQIANRVPLGNVVGLDLSSEMTDYATSKYKRNNLSFIAEDVTAMTYQNCFDIVVSFWTLSWVANQKTALINIVKSLKENGKILLMYPMRHDIYDVIDTIVIKPKWEKYFQGFSASRPFIDQSSYLILLIDLNLDNLCVNRKQLDYTFSNQKEMAQFINGWLPHVDKIEDEATKDAFITEIINEYLDIKELTNFTMHFNVLEINAVKPSHVLLLRRFTMNLPCTNQEWRKPMYTVKELDLLLFKTLKHLEKNWHNTEPTTGIVACCLKDEDGGEELEVYATSTKVITEVGVVNWRHAERNAYDAFKVKYGKDPSEHAVFVTTLSPCSKNLKHRGEGSCSELIESLHVRQVHSGVLDTMHMLSTEGYSSYGFFATVTQDPNLAEMCQRLIAMFPKYDARINSELFAIKKELGDSFFEPIHLAEETFTQRDIECTDEATLSYDIYDKSTNFNVFSLDTEYEPNDNQFSKNDK